MLRRNSGQSIVEYAVLLGVVIAALLIMQMFIKRGYQGGLKESADKFGEQFSAGGTTVHQRRTMEGNQNITEQVATDPTIDTFAGTVGLDSVGEGAIAGGAVSVTTRSGATQVAETRSRTDAAAVERTRTGEYQNTTVDNLPAQDIDF